jgi:hypothetical protein
MKKIRKPLEPGDCVIAKTGIFKGDLGFVVRVVTREDGLRASVVSFGIGMISLLPHTDLQRYV